MQIAEYAGGRRQRIVAHVGSAHTEAELGMLLARARGLLADPGQQALNIDAEERPVVAALVEAPAEPALIEAPQPASSPQRAGPGQVLSTASRLLFDALAGVYDELGFGVQNRARDVVNGQKAMRNPRFVKIGKGTPTLDEAALQRARALVGLKGYVTNIDASTMPATEVIAAYHDLWQVEQSFRMSKTDLRARPLFARTEDAINAHLTIVFAALAVARTVQHRTGLALRNVLRQLRPLRSATISINGATQTFPPAIPPAIPPAQQAILDAITSRKVTH